MCGSGTGAEKALQLCVIGDPVSHSLSPQIHTALLRGAGRTGSYTAVPVTASELADFVSRSAQGAYDGFNVTMPHKQTIVPLLDELDDAARRIGAVNTVVVRHGRTRGYNTDGAGFLHSVGQPLAQKRVLVLGAGGAASAVCDAACHAGAQVTVCCRRSEQASRLDAYVASWSSLESEASQCDVLVNATPLGMTGQENFADFGFLRRCHALVYDLVYEPRQTALLASAQALGLSTVGGLALLHAQAELSFSLFCGAEAGIAWAQDGGKR